ncbi:aromatic-ring hydroxylase C-terminal domain-containing protein [Kroppenstedtia sanguinis]
MANRHACLNGKRLTELKLRLQDGRTVSSYQLLHSGQFLLLQFVSDGSNDLEGQSGDHLHVVPASLAEATVDWEDVHTALIRPDGHVAWAVSRSDPTPMKKAREGMARWCGEAHCK